MPIPTDSDARILDDRARRLRREGVTTDEREGPARADDSGADRDRAGSGASTSDADSHLLEDSGTAIAAVDAAPDFILDPVTGEALARTVENAAVVLEWARAAKDRLNDLIADATSIVIEESRVRGGKTFHLDGAKVTLSGGPGVEYDPQALREALRAADCPEDRIDALIKTEVIEKVDRSVLRQLTGANDDYKAASELAELPSFKNYSAKVER